MIIGAYCFQVMGVFGVSILCLHKPFDLINGFVIDDLHRLFLGVTKTLLSGLMLSIGLATSTLDHRCMRGGGIGNASLDAHTPALP